MFKILGVDHIGIASTTLEDGEFWKLLGLQYTGDETVADQKVTTAFYPTTEDKQHGEIELLVATDETSPIAKFIEKNGGRGGIQHIALRVDNLEAALADLKEKGVKLIDETPRKGAGGAMIAFIHPKATHGVLLELCQRG
jgi:methylmalonyl-CoA/ethylmalonyl-CoA epimerase